MGRIVIVAFRPKPGQADKLARLLRDHHPKLRAEGLVTGREPVQMASADGTMVEVFEWASGAAIEAAHGNAAVQDMWRAFAEVCDYVPIGAVEESGQLFSEFTALN